jgi:parvulin-like peptidyl-prolyl isomerase
MRMFRYFTIFLLIAFLSLGCKSSKSNDSKELAYNNNSIVIIESSGEPVLQIAGQNITADDIILSQVGFIDKTTSPAEYFAPIARTATIEEFKARIKSSIEKILEDDISDIVLYHYAKKQFPENNQESLDKAAESELRKFAMKYDSDQARTDEALKQIHLTRTSFLEQQKRKIIIQWYFSTELKDEDPVTYRDMQAQYDKMKDEYFADEQTIQFSLIDIQPAKLTTGDPNQNKSVLAEKLAKELIVKIRAGANFAELAKQYSNGPMKESGGLWMPVHPDSLAAPYDWIPDAARKTKPGEIAELHSTPEHFFIMKLENKNIDKYKPFEQVQKQVKNAVVAVRRREALEKVNSLMFEQTNITQADKFIDFCIEKIYRTSRQQKNS